MMSDQATEQRLGLRDSEIQQRVLARERHSREIEGFRAAESLEIGLNVFGQSSIEGADAVIPPQN